MAGHPGQELPVAAYPAMLTFGGNIVTAREILNDLDVGGEPGAGEDALEEIVAEKRVLGHTPSERRLEGVDIIDALAGVRSLAEKVLIDIRDRRRIGVQAGRTREDPLKEGAVAAVRQGRCDTRLENPVAGTDPLPGRIESRSVKWVRHLSDQASHRIARQSRIGIEGDNEADIGGHVGLLSGHRHETGVGRPAEKAVELMQLAALPLPSHPGVLAGIEQTPAMQEEEAVAGGSRALAAGQLRDRLDGGGEEMRIVFDDVTVRVHAVR
jgi:hypothetical protein